MMQSYITIGDISAVVDNTTLNMLLGGSRESGREGAKEADLSIIAGVIPSVLETVKGYTRHWYDMEREMRPTYEYDNRQAYKAGDRVIEVGRMYIALCDTEQGANIGDLTRFEQRDDRNPKLVEICSVLAVYALFRRVNPRVIPEQRQYDQEDAMKVLRDIQRGRIQLDIASREDVASDDAGQSVCWGAMKGVTNEIY